jgi:hypothetical protein
MAAMPSTPNARPMSRILSSPSFWFFFYSFFLWFWGWISRKEPTPEVATVSVRDTIVRGISQRPTVGANV